MCVGGGGGGGGDLPPLFPKFGRQVANLGGIPPSLSGYNPVIVSMLPQSKFPHWQWPPVQSQGTTEQPDSQGTPYSSGNNWGWRNQESHEVVISRDKTNKAILWDAVHSLDPGDVALI